MAVHSETEGAVAVVTIDRPDVANAVDRETADLLVKTFEAFEGDGDLRVAVLTGAGGKFCAGADLKAISRRAGNRVEVGGTGPLGVTRMMLLYLPLALVGRQWFGIAGIFGAYAVANLLSGLLSYLWARRAAHTLCAIAYKR